MANKAEYVELGLACADVCKALHRGMNGKKVDDLSQSVREAVNQLKAWVEPVMYSFDKSLMMLWIAELWRRSGRRSPNGVNGTRPLDLSTQRMIRI